jgi:hypothetical protein
MGLPMEIVDKIFSYLPILDEAHIRLNNSIKISYKMRQVVKLYMNHFQTEDKNESMYFGCSLSWVTTDLILFLNNETDVENNISDEYQSFLKRITNMDIKTPTHHDEFMSKFVSPAHILRTFTNKMTIDEMKLFRFWVKTQLFGKAQALIGSRTHPYFD